MPKRPRDTHYFDARVTFNGIHLPVRVPAALEAEEVGDYSIINLIQTFSPAANPSFPPPYHPHLHSAGPVTPPVILLLNALLTCKRIVFLGTTVPAHTVAQDVLAACALGSGGGAGVLRGFIERAFPYSNLTNRDNHESVPGYIAGVANPRFEAFTQSWDVFCNIDTGKITVSKDLKIPSGAVISPNYVATSPVDEPSSPTPGSEDSDSLKSPTSNGGNTTPNTLGMGFPPAVKDKEYRESTDVVFMEEVSCSTFFFHRQFELTIALHGTDPGCCCCKVRRDDRSRSLLRLCDTLHTASQQIRRGPLGQHDHRLAHHCVQEHPYRPGQRSRLRGRPCKRVTGLFAAH